MIASASWQFERRRVIRETWASQTIADKNLKYLFFIGNDHKLGFILFLKHFC